MKLIFAICMIVTSTFVWAADTAAPAPAKKLPAAKAEVPDVKVDKAVGENAKTVEETVKQSKELKDKTVLIRGKVVKYNPGIMKRNWVHLRDGSGSEADESNDILVTTTDSANVGDIVTAKGIVHTDKDFGSGYAYKVMLEEATLLK